MNSRSQLVAGHVVPPSPGITTSQLMTALQQILHEPVSKVLERERTALEEQLAQTHSRCVLFGAGSLGRRALAELKRIGVPPLAISDNNPSLWGTAIEGTKILSPKDAAEQFGEDAMFFIVIRNELHWYRETLEQLYSLGCRHIASAASIGWRFPETFLPFLLHDLPHKLYEQSDEVLLAAQLWEDDASRDEYLAQVRLRALGDPCGLRKPAVEESYFLDGVFDAEAGDVILDCGAFDGDTIRAVIARQPNFGAIEAVEADSNSFARMEDYVATLEPRLRDRIHLHQCAVGARRGKVRFENTGSLIARVSDTGATVVEMELIDELCASVSLTMIKMDIEGAEFDALMGATQVIQRDRPILAVCVYHSQEDLWRLPLLMRAMCPEYRMYLKAYRGDGIQTVAYAVPPQRILQSFR